MCRLLCYKGVPAPLETLITKPENSLVFQSRDASFHPGCKDKRNIRVNGDGFGVAWYNPARPDSEGGCVIKFATPAWSSTNLLNIAKHVDAGLLFAHVRAASDGSDLVGKVNYENCHPFKHKRYTFMHNGGIPSFPRLKRRLLACLSDEAFSQIEGTTDSEVCFALFLDELPDTDQELTAQQIAQALQQTIARLVHAIESLEEPDAAGGGSRTWPGPGTGTRTEGQGPASAAAVGAHAAGQQPQRRRAAAAAPCSLNFCVTDGRHIVCSRYRNHPVQQPPSLFYLSGAGFVCDKEGSCLRPTAREPQTSIVISSEPLCRVTKCWQLVPKNSLVIVEGWGAPAGPSGSGNGQGKKAQGPGAPAGAAVPRARTGANSGGGCQAVGSSCPSDDGLVKSVWIQPLRCHPSDASPEEPFSAAAAPPAKAGTGAGASSGAGGTSGCGGGGGGRGGEGVAGDSDMGGSGCTGAAALPPPPAAAAILSSPSPYIFSPKLRGLGNGLAGAGALGGLTGGDCMPCLGLPAAAAAAADTHGKAGPAQAVTVIPCTDSPPPVTAAAAAAGALSSPPCVATVVGVAPARIASVVEAEMSPGPSRQQTGGGGGDLSGRPPSAEAGGPCNGM